MTSFQKNRAVLLERNLRFISDLEAIKQDDEAQKKFKDYIFNHNKGLLFFQIDQLRSLLHLTVHLLISDFINEKRPDVINYVISKTEQKK